MSQTREALANAGAFPLRVKSLNLRGTGRQRALRINVFLIFVEPAKIGGQDDLALLVAAHAHPAAAGQSAPLTRPRLVCRKTFRKTFRKMPRRLLLRCSILRPAFHASNVIARARPVYDSSHSQAPAVGSAALPVQAIRCSVPVERPTRPTHLHPAVFQVAARCPRPARKTAAP
jgi:hypothetical protein